VLYPSLSLPFFATIPVSQKSWTITSSRMRIQWDSD
jgi:hypothetical protein